MTRDHDTAPTRRAVLREHGGRASNGPIYVGDEAYLTLPSRDAEAEVTCSVKLPSGDQVTVDVRHRATDLFADHVAVFPVDREGRHRYTFILNGESCRGSFMVRPASQRKKPKRNARQGWSK